MKKLSSLIFSILFLVSLTAAAPLQVEVQKLLGAEVGEANTVEVQSKSFQPKQRGDAFSIFASSGDDIIEPGDDITGELELTIDCGTADICYADYWLQVDGTNHFAQGNTYYASDGETITVKVDFEAPDSTGVYLGYWYRGIDYNVEDGSQIDTDSFIVAKDSDDDGVADSSDDCPNTPGSKLYDGCPPPDSDGDGVPDDEDECEYTGDQGFGLKDNGCPIQDSDGDGIADPDDECDSEPGPSSTDGCPDTDGDGVIDKNDEYPGDPDCVEDSDGDGFCDNNDAAPNDPSEWKDSDGDGVPDNDDEYPNDPDCSSDSDDDGVCDAEDAFPNDPSVSSDSDGDGVGDANDEFPNDPSCTEDSDGDGVCDSKDAFPNDSSETKDSDGDGVGDNADQFPNDSSCSKDSDGDQVCDSEDEYPNDSGKTSDTDGDSIADSVDACVNRKGPERFNGCPDEDGDGVPLNQDQCPGTNSGSEVDENGCRVTVDNKTGDGTDNNQGTGETGDTGEEQVGTSFDRQVFQTLQNLYTSILSIFN